jgi:hypothetical protein
MIVYTPNSPFDIGDETSATEICPVGIDAIVWLITIPVPKFCHVIMELECSECFALLKAIDEFNYFLKDVHTLCCLV